MIMRLGCYADVDAGVLLLPGPGAAPSCPAQLAGTAEKRSELPLAAYMY